MKDINKIVAESILRFRKEQGLSQEKLAIKAKLHRAYIGQIERNEKSIGLTNLQKLADALNIDIRDFFNEK